MHNSSKRQRRLKKKNKKIEYRKRKKRSAENRSISHQQWAPVKMKMFSVPNIFRDDVTREQRLDVMRSIGKKAQADFLEKYPRVERWLKDYDPLYILSFCCFYWLSHPEGIDLEATGELEFYPYFVEIMQAFALYQPRAISARPLLEEAKTLKEEMIEIGNLLSIRMFDMPEGLAEKDIHAYELRMEIMIQTIAIRNWAYQSQMKKISYDLAELIKDEFCAVHSVNPVTLLDVLFGLTDKVRSFARKGTYQEMIVAYCEAFPEIKLVEGSAVEDLWSHCGKDLKNLMAMLICHSDLRLKETQSFDLADVKAISDGDDASFSALTGIIDKLSYKFGELKDFDKEHIILNNPVHKRPFIRIDENKFFSAIWMIIPHLALGLIENLIAENAGLQRKYSDTKARYLEDSIEKLFRSAFPNGSICRGSIWTDVESGKEYENDLTLVVDSFAVVVEAKSGGVSPPARRGAPNRLWKTLQELIEEPSEQALRFVKFLNTHKELHTLKTRSGVTNTIDSRSIKYFIPLGVTLSELGGISGNLKKLIEAGVVEKSMGELCPSVSVTDLEVVFELLQLEAEKIHYLARRREFEAHFDYQGDELDLLAFYLENGFNIGEAEYSNDMAINLSPKSKELDPFILWSSVKKDIQRPQLALTKWWRDMLTTMASRKTEGWLETSFVLLNTTENDQREFERKCSKLKSRVLKGVLPNPHNWVIWISGPRRRRYGVIGYPYTLKDREVRNSVLGGALRDTRGAVAIGFDLNRNDYPYSVLARRLSTDLFDTLTRDPPPPPP